MVRVIILEMGAGKPKNLGSLELPAVPGEGDYVAFAGRTELYRVASVSWILSLPGEETAGGFGSVSVLLKRAAVKSLPTKAEHP